MFYHVRLSRNYWFISTYQIAQNKKAETLASLEKMCYHAIEYDRSYINNHGKYYTSIFTNKLVYPEPNKDFHELKEHTECHYLLERLQHNRYDCIRQDPCFISVVEKLSQFAKWVIIAWVFEKALNLIEKSECWFFGTRSLLKFSFSLDFGILQSLTYTGMQAQVICIFSFLRICIRQSHLLFWLLQGSDILHLQALQ